MIVINLQRIAEKLDTDINSAKEWVRKFAAYSPNYLIPLNEYIAKRDYPGIASIAYKIKSASALLGIFDLMELADHVYQAAKTTADIDYLEKIKEIEQAFEFLKTI